MHTTVQNKCWKILTLQCTPIMAMLSIILYQSAGGKIYQSAGGKIFTVVSYCC